MTGQPARGMRTATCLCLVAAIAAGICAGCRSVRYAERADNLFELPESYGTFPVDSSVADELAADFGVAELNALIREAFANNFNLAAAAARLRQAEALARQAGASLWPAVDADAGASRSKFSGIDSFSADGTGQPGNGQGGFPGGDGGPVNRFEVSVGATYEVDLWRRLWNTRQAAKLDAEAARLDAATVATTLAAQVAERYFEVVAQRERIRLLGEQLELSERFAELTLFRLRQGAANALDVNQQRQQAESLHGLIAQARAAESLARHQLAVLLGRPPQKRLQLDAAVLPALPPLAAPGVPAELLIRRPDIRAAFLRIQASDRRTAAAVADLFPRIRLSASVFFQQEELARLFDETFWRLAALASQPLFDGGRRFAEIDRAEAVAGEQLQQYGQTVLTALQEVQDALVSEARQEEFVGSLMRQHEIAGEVLDLARERYRLGAADYLRVLTALQSLQQIEQDLIEARRRQFSNRVQLFRALGGGWSDGEWPGFREDRMSDSGPVGDDGAACAVITSWWGQ